MKDDLGYGKTMSEEPFERRHSLSSIISISNDEETEMPSQVYSA